MRSSSPSGWSSGRSARAATRPSWAAQARSLGAERALRRPRRDRRRRRGARGGAPAPRLLVQLRRRAHQPEADERLRGGLVLERPGGLAPALAADPQPLLGAPCCSPAGPRDAARPGSCRSSGSSATFFAFLLVFVASPFATQPPPADGAGLNPSLQNPYMLAHPPLLYLGYVGLTIPFAFAMGALLARRTDELWIVATRRWTLLAWTFLGVGQLLGAHWAYVEIGWGGYYAWDPVENAALMPWLAATAFLHSVMIQEKRGMLKVWNVLLVIARVLPLALRHVPDALRRPQLDPLVHVELDRAVVPRLHRVRDSRRRSRSSSCACRCCARARGSSRSSRARRRSSTTTCCSSRSA